MCLCVLSTVVSQLIDQLSVSTTSTILSGSTRPGAKGQGEGGIPRSSGKASGSAKDRSPQTRSR